MGRALDSAMLRFEHRRTRPSLLFATLLITGCGAQQRAAEKLIDPRLRSEGVLVERQVVTRDLVLGRYRVDAMELDEVEFDGTGPLAADAAGRTRPTQQLRLTFTLAGGATDWSVACVGQRRQPADHDLAAAVDELRDEVAVQCQLSGGDQRWVLSITGNLGANMLGGLQRAGEQEPAKTIELIMWYRLWTVARRHLPASLVVVRNNDAPEAALILDAPERAWLAPELDDSGRELALASMLALRLLPLGFDG